MFRACVCVYTTNFFLGSSMIGRNTPITGNKTRNYSSAAVSVLNLEVEVWVTRDILIVFLPKDWCNTPISTLAKVHLP